MFGEQESESPRLPSPWIARSRAATPVVPRSPHGSLAAAGGGTGGGGQTHERRRGGRIRSGATSDGSSTSGLGSASSTPPSEPPSHALLSELDSVSPTTTTTAAAAAAAAATRRTVGRGRSDQALDLKLLEDDLNSISLGHSKILPHDDDDDDRASSSLDSVELSVSRGSDSASNGRRRRGASEVDDVARVIVEDVEVGIGQVQRLMPEVDEQGHIEYKLKLLRPTSLHRLERLITQLRWRLVQGGGRAVYELGVLDNGVLVGLEGCEMRESLETLGTMLSGLGGGLVSIKRIVRLGSKATLQGSGAARLGERPQGPERTRFESFAVEAGDPQSTFQPYPSPPSPGTGATTNETGASSPIPIAASPRPAVRSDSSNSPRQPERVFNRKGKEKGPTPYPANRTATELAELKRSKRDARRVRKERELERMTDDAVCGARHGKRAEEGRAGGGTTASMPGTQDPAESAASERPVKKTPFNSHPGPVAPRQKPPRPPKPPRRRRSRAVDPLLVQVVSSDELDPSCHGWARGENAKDRMKAGTTMRDRMTGIEVQKSKQKLRREQRELEEGLNGGRASLKPTLAVPEGEVRYVVEVEVVVARKGAGRRGSLNAAVGVDATGNGGSRGSEVGFRSARASSQDGGPLSTPAAIEGGESLETDESELPSDRERRPSSASPTSGDGRSRVHGNGRRHALDPFGEDSISDEQDGDDDEEGWNYLEFDLRELSLAVKANHSSNGNSALI
ncbi:hypothetical protein JCM10212_000754 [Sporobolomyces blumeae]